MRLGALALALVVLACAAAYAGVPSQINTQGVLRDAGGDLVDLPDATIVFRVYDVATDGTALFEDTQDVPVVMGVFDTLLPSDPLTALPPAVQAKLALGEPLWLSIQLDGQDELPRTPLVSVPYAFTANRALVASGLDCSGCIDASDINTSTFSAQHLGYAPGGGDLVTATTVAGAISELDDYLADHVANDNAHHPADSAGIAIQPTSVTVGNTSLTDGTIDLGDGANDALTKAKVETLTGGGNADALHTHTAQSISGLPSGGSCHVFYGANQPSCPSGFSAAQNGITIVPVGTAVSTGASIGIGAPVCAAYTTTGGSYYLRWLGAYNSAASGGDAQLYCTVCCPKPATELGQGCIANAEYSKSVTDGESLGYTTYNSQALSPTSALFKIGVKNRSYHFDRIEIGVPDYRITGEWPTGVGAVTSQDLEIVAADGTVLAKAPLIRTSSTTTMANYRGVPQNPQRIIYVYEARIDLDYAGDTEIRIRAMDVRVSPSVPVAGLLADTSYGCATPPCESTPMFSIYGCLE